MSLIPFNAPIGATADSNTVGDTNYYIGAVVNITDLNDAPAQLFSDRAGTAPLLQNGIDNVTDATGSFKCYMEQGSYKITCLGVTDEVEQCHSAINDLSQAYTFATVSDYKASTIAFPDGKQIRLLDRFSTYTKATGTGSGNNATIIDSTSLSQNIVFNDDNGGLVNVRQMGVVGDGITDDTTALRAALTFSAVRGIREFKVRTTEMIIINNECQFNLMGMSILGETTSDLEPWLSIRHDDVDISHGKFGNGLLTGKPIVVGDYSAPDTILRRFAIHTNKFNVGDMNSNRGIISAVGKVFELDVSNKNRFQSGSSLAGKNIACVYMQLSTATVDFETQMAWNIGKNTSVGIPYLFNNFSNAFTGGVSINKNTIRNGELSLRTYHVHNCIVSKNTFIDCTKTMYIWQRTDFTNNILIGCGDGVAAVKFETPSNTQITDNNIRNSSGAGVILDGGNSNYTFENNNIWQSSAAGLIINPNFGFGGQIVGLEVSGGRITDKLRASYRVKDYLTTAKYGNQGRVHFR